MKRMTYSLLLAASLLAVSSCNLNLRGRASEPKTVDVTFSCSTGPERRLGARGLMDDPAVLSVTLTATDASETVRGGPLALAKGAASWTGSMSITVTDNENITFEAVGWSGVGGTGNVLYIGWNTFNLTEADSSLSLTLGLAEQLRTWTEQTGAGLGSWVCIASSISGTNLAAASNYFYTSTDYGATWTYQEAADKRSFTSIASSFNGAMLAAVDHGNSSILTSADSGATWTEHANLTVEGEPAALNAIASSWYGDKLAATNAGGNIYISADSGATWSAGEASSWCNWSSITSSEDGTMLAAADMGDELGGYIYTSVNSGADWTEQTGSGRRAWQSITSSRDGTMLAAAVQGGCIYISTDSGVTWKERTTAGSRVWRSISSEGDHNGAIGWELAATTDSGFIYTSKDAGRNWTEQTGAGSRAWQGIAVSADGANTIAAVCDGYIYTSTVAPAD